MSITATPTRDAKVLTVQAPSPTREKPNQWVEAKVWTSFLLEVDDEPDYPADLSLVVEFDEEKTVFVVRELRVRADAVTTAGLREIPLAKLRDIGVEKVMGTMSPGVALLRPGGTLRVSKVSRIVRGATDTLVLVDAATSKVATRGHRIADEKLEQVAATYREAIAAGESTQKAVMLRCDAGSVSTAAKWIMQARKRGFLGPTVKGKVGER